MKILKNAIDAIHAAALDQREIVIQQYSNELEKAACALCAARDHEQYGRFLLAIDPRYSQVLGRGASHDPAILRSQINSKKIKQFLDNLKESAEYKSS